MEEEAKKTDGLSRTHAIIAVLVVVIFVLLFLIGRNFYRAIKQTKQPYLSGLNSTPYVTQGADVNNNPTSTSKNQVKKYAPQTFGYIGCSNTHDTVYGYHIAPGNKNLFWPFGSRTEYPIEGKTILFWSQTNNPIWQKFDQMKARYNGSQDPPVIWVQMCENLDQTESNYGQGSYNDVVNMLKNLKAHSPTSIIYISPLQSYDPVTLCIKMGAGGHAVAELTGWADKAVSDGLALRGPGSRSDGLYPLGPLTAQNSFKDRCHPNGDPVHGPGTGAEFLGSQIMNFFDNLSQ